MNSSLSSPSSLLKTRLIAIWFVLQVAFNVISALYLTLHPPDEPISWFGRVDLTVNTGINAALAVGFWRRTPWAWATAVWLVPLYWALHAWHMLVPEEGLLLWPFLMVDAVILGYLLSSRGRQALHAPWDRWMRLSFLPAPMFALGLYALLAPVIGMFIAIAGAAAVVFVGWRRTIADLKSQTSK